LPNSKPGSLFSLKNVTNGLPGSDVLAARHARVRGALETSGLDGLIVTTPANIRYLANHIGTAGTLLITRTDIQLLVDFRYKEVVQSGQASLAACPGLVVRDVPDSYDEALVDATMASQGRSLGIEAGHLTVARQQWLTRTWEARGANITVRSTERFIERFRAVKDDAEITVLRQAAQGLTAVAALAMDVIRVGTTEREVAAVIETALRKAGYERPAFDTIVASGPNSALPHYRAGDRTLHASDLVVLDFGGVLDGYCSDLTRTVSVGQPSPEALRIHAAVRDAQAAAIEAVKPGMTTTDVDAAARQVLVAHGLGEAFGHGTGHGLGLDVHEDPRVSKPRSDVPPVRLERGMVFTIEPGAYLPGFGGVRIEDDVLVTETGCEVLTSVPRDLRVCE
jgi:Xaa-Pro aminopeptidase